MLLVNRSRPTNNIERILSFVKDNFYDNLVNPKMIEGLIQYLYVYDLASIKNQDLITAFEYLLDKSQRKEFSVYHQRMLKSIFKNGVLSKIAEIEDVDKISNIFHIIVSNHSKLKPMLFSTSVSYNHVEFLLNNFYKKLLKHYLKDNHFGLKTSLYYDQQKESFVFEFDYEIQFDAFHFFIDRDYETFEHFIVFKEFLDAIDKKHMGYNVNYEEDKRKGEWIVAFLSRHISYPIKTSVSAFFEDILWDSQLISKTYHKLMEKHINNLREKYYEEYEYEDNV